MGSSKRAHPSKEESKEEKKARKRQKKEAKKRKEEAGEEKQTNQFSRRSHDNEVALLTSKKIRLSASILPSGLGNVQTNVERCIHDFLLKYSESLEGIMLSYKNVEIMANSRGRIVEELPHIHYDVTCDALVFTPLPKAEVKGKVTESFHSHISLVVLNYFNASISAAHLREAGFEYDENKELWYNTESEYVIEKGSRVLFKIENVHEAGKY